MAQDNNITLGFKRIVQKYKARTGNLANLQTTNKTNLVAAINEVAGAVSINPFSERPVYVDTYGATGDGATDDRAAIQSCVNAASVVGFRRKSNAPTTYRVTDQIVLGGVRTLIIEEGVTLFFDNTVLQKSLFFTQYNLRMRGGGTLKGAWLMTNHNTNNCNNDKKQDNNLVTIQPGVSPVTSVVIENLTFTRALSNPVYWGYQGLTSSLINGLEIRNCQFVENFEGPLLSNLNGTVAIGDILIDNCLIDTTAAPAAGVYQDNMERGGNGLTCWGMLNNVTIRRLKTRNIGRMGIELFQNGSDFLAGRIGKGLRIQNCDIRESRWFCLSAVSMHSVTIRDNDFTGSWPHYLEIMGNDVTIETNRLAGVGISTTDQPRTYGLRDRQKWRIVNNHIWDTAPVAGTFFGTAFGAYGQTATLLVSFLDGGVIEDNHLYIANPRNTTYVSSPLQVENSVNVDINRNKIELSNPAMVIPPVRLRGLHRFEFSGNKLQFTGYTDNTLQQLVRFEGLSAGRMTGNSGVSDAAFSLAYGGQPTGYPMAGDPAYVRWHNGTSMITTALANNSPLVSPPGSPADGAMYIVGESPTGAFSGNARKVARYTTAGGWSFMTVKDVRLYNTSSQLPLSAIPVWQTGVSGDAYLLFTGGWLANVKFENNDFGACDLVKGSGNRAFGFFQAFFFNVSFIGSETPYITSPATYAGYSVTTP